MYTIYQYVIHVHTTRIQEYNERSVNVTGVYVYYISIFYPCTYKNTRIQWNNIEIYPENICTVRTHTFTQDS